MAKLRIEIALLGYLPLALNLDKITKWKSELFEITTSKKQYAIISNSDGYEWEYSDENIEKQLPVRENSDILIVVTNVPIQDCYYARRFSNNRVCLTYNTMADILQFNNIPLENLLIKVLYSVSFVYKRYGNRIPLMSEQTNFTHDETRGCIFDMNGIKSDIVFSLNKPQLCHTCVETLICNKQYRIERNLIQSVQKELIKVNKEIYFQIVDFVKRRPILALIISSAYAIILGVMGS